MRPNARRATCLERIPAWGAALALLTLGACGGPPAVEREGAPLLQTSELRYTLTREELGFSVTIPYTFRNETGGRVFLPNCAGDIRPALQVEREGSWFDAWEPFRDGCVDEPVIVEPGAVLEDTLQVFGGAAGSNLVPSFAFEDVEGVYRLLWLRAVTRYEDGRVDPAALLPVRQRTSNRFVLER